MTELANVYDLNEATEKLRAAGFDVSPDWLKRHTEIPRIRIGRGIRFTDAILTDLIAARTERATPAPAASFAPKQRRRS